MREDLEQKLREAAPTLYRGTDIHNQHRDEKPPFSFECDDGWFDFLLKASVDLEANAQKSVAAGEEPVKAVQVKEKYGTLRFYVDNYNEEVSSIINAAEYASETTCEKCGGLGRLRGKRWLYTACDPHTRVEDLEPKVL